MPRTASSISPAYLAKHGIEIGKPGKSPKVEPSPDGVLARATVQGEGVGVNAMYANIPGKGRVLTQAGRDWKICLASDLAGLPHLPEQRYEVRLAFHGNWETIRGQPRVRDVDGPLKAVLDELAYALRVDDKWFYRLIVEKHHAPEARVEIEVRELA